MLKKETTVNYLRYLRLYIFYIFKTIYMLYKIVLYFSKQKLIY